MSSQASKAFVLSAVGGGALASAPLGEGRLRLRVNLSTCSSSLVLLSTNHLTTVTVVGSYWLKSSSLLKIRKLEKLLIIIPLI